MCIHGISRAWRRSHSFRAIFRPVRYLSVYMMNQDLQCTRYISNIEMAGGVIRYVPLQPPKDGDTRTSSAAEWAIDMEALERTMNPKTKMIVRETSFL